MPVCLEKVYTDTKWMNDYPVAVNKKGEIFIANSSYHILKSIDNGSTWQDITSNALNIGVNRMYFDKEDILYLASAESMWKSNPDSVTTVTELPIAITEYTFSQNYPNPFNPVTRISYQIPVDANVKIELFNIIGQKIAELVNMSAGSYSVDVNASANLASGIYVYKMTAFGTNGINFTSSKKMMLMK